MDNGGRACLVGESWEGMEDALGRVFRAMARRVRRHSIAGWWWIWSVFTSPATAGEVIEASFDARFK